MEYEFYIQAYGEHDQYLEEISKDAETEEEALEHAGETLSEWGVKYHHLVVVEKYPKVCAYCWDGDSNEDDYWEDGKARCRRHQKVIENPDQDTCDDWELDPLIRDGSKVG